MKEWKLPNKVIEFMAIKENKSILSRLHKNRTIASIANQLSQEMDHSFEQQKRHLTRFVHHLLKDELK